MKSGMQFPEVEMEVEKFNQLFQETLGKLRAAQIKRKRQPLTIVPYDLDEEMQKYQGLYAPYGIPPLWHLWWLRKSEPLRQRVADFLCRAARRLQEWGKEIRSYG